MPDERHYVRPGLRFTQSTGIEGFSGKDVSGTLRNSCNQQHETRFCQKCRHFTGWLEYWNLPDPYSFHSHRQSRAASTGQPTDIPIAFTALQESCVLSGTKESSASQGCRSRSLQTLNKPWPMQSDLAQCDRVSEQSRPTRHVRRMPASALMYTNEC